jgi:predicted nucleic acid-binding protein
LTLILVDTNVILDVIEDDPQWMQWSLRQLDLAALNDTLCINAIIYAELSIAYATIEQLEAMLVKARFEVEPIPREALFLAGKAFMRYRRSRGVKTGVLPDFFIGAHAAISGHSLLTRDAGRYQTYFPKLALISP